eukprot:scaffold77290_cov58-Phaeocystis_antarctica.AAC.2
MVARRNAAARRWCGTRWSLAQGYPGNVADTVGRRVDDRLPARRDAAARHQGMLKGLRRASPRPPAAAAPPAAAPRARQGAAAYRSQLNSISTQLTGRARNAPGISRPFNTREAPGSAWGAPAYTPPPPERSALHSPTCQLYTASARRRHWSASPESLAFATGASHSAADRSKSAAASLNSADERGPASQAPHRPVSTMARMLSADSSLGTALTTLADSALSASSFHHSGLLVEDPCRGLCPDHRAHRIALSGLEVSLCGLHFVPRVAEHCTEVEVRLGPVGPQGDGLAVGLGCFAKVVLRRVPESLSHQFRVLVARLRGVPGLPLRGLAILLPPHPTILLLLPLLPQPLVEHPVQLPSARVRRAVDAAQVRRRQLLIAAHVTNGVLLSVVVHV